jgi:hypothetical protein
VPPGKLGEVIAKRWLAIQARGWLFLRVHGCNPNKVKKNKAKKKVKNLLASSTRLYKIPLYNIQL